MPVISPNAFAPPAANDFAASVGPDLREQVRRLERAHSAARAGQAAVGQQPIDLGQAERQGGPARALGAMGSFQPPHLLAQ